VEVYLMNLVLRGVEVARDGWKLQAGGMFSEGIHLVAGPVGSGKSTLAMLIAGSSTPSCGKIERAGIASLQLGMQFPEHQVTATTITGEILSWDLDPQEILAAASLRDRGGTNPLLLSRGELRRLVLACILARDPDLLLLDEPFASLDCREKTALCARIGERHRGITILFSHESWHLPRIDHLWEMRNGSLHDHGEMPGAVERWHSAPPLLHRRFAAQDHAAGR
jgi:energy-coupling factor transport system ATP-binding protein